MRGGQCAMAHRMERCHRRHAGRRDESAPGSEGNRSNVGGGSQPRCRIAESPLPATAPIPWADPPSFSPGTHHHQCSGLVGTSAIHARLRQLADIDVGAESDSLAAGIHFSPKPIAPAQHRLLSGLDRAPQKSCDPQRIRPIRRADQPANTAAIRHRNTRPSDLDHVPGKSEKIAGDAFTIGTTCHQHSSHAQAGRAGFAGLGITQLSPGYQGPCAVEETQPARLQRAGHSATRYSYADAA